MVDENRIPARGWSSGEAFRSFLTEWLGSEWDVKVVAQTPDRRESRDVLSVAAVASWSDKVKLHATHDRGVDVVLLSLGEESIVPFEDLAIAKGIIKTNDLVNLAIQAVEKPPGRTAFTLEETLTLIREWKEELVGDLDPSNRLMRQKLKEISDEFEVSMNLLDRAEQK